MNQTAQPADSIRHDHLWRLWISAICVTALATVVGCSQHTTATDTLQAPGVVAADPGDGVELSGVVAADPGDGDRDAGRQDGGGGGESFADDPQPADIDAVSGAVDAGLVDQPGPLRFERGTYGAGVVDLGYRLWPTRYSLERFEDRVAVRVDSVLVRGGVVRGLVQNMSQELFARGVTVSVGDKRWVFPLTVQPTEVVPFVIEGYEGASDPGMIEFEVAADLAPTPDPRRSFYILGNPGQLYEPWGHVRSLFPDFAFADDRPPEGTPVDQKVHYYETVVELWAPTSHPSIADEATTQRIDDLRIYLTEMDDDGRVLDVREIVPYIWTQTGVSDDGGEIWGFPRVDRLPFVHPYPPDGPGSASDVGTIVGFLVGFMPDTPEFALTVGGAG